MLDLRTYRDKMVSTAAPFPLPQAQAEADDPDRTLTGAEQMAWLKDSLARDTAQWKLVGNPVMIAPLSMGQLPAEAVSVISQVTGEHPSDGFPFNTDQWDGYTADRRELFDHIAEQGIKDTVFLTGDIHSGWAADLPLDPGAYPAGGTAGVEFVCTSVTSSNIDDITGAPPRTATLAHRGRPARQQPAHQVLQLRRPRLLRARRDPGAGADGLVRPRGPHPAGHPGVLGHLVGDHDRVRHRRAGGRARSPEREVNRCVSHHRWMTDRPPRR